LSSSAARMAKCKRNEAHKLPTELKAVIEEMKW
jgi:hypothetical protein